MSRAKTKTEAGIDSVREMDEIIRQPVRPKAREWFKRPPYSIKRGDSGEQRKVEAVPFADS